MYNVGDRVIYTNPQGVCWGERTIIGTEPAYEGESAGRGEVRYFISPTDTPWYSHRAEDFSPITETYALMGRRFKVLATFPDTDDGTNQANAYMLANPGASVLAVSNGRVVLAHVDDRGVPVPMRDL